MLNSGQEEVIIACNTASIKKDAACDAAAKFLLAELSHDNRSESIFQGDNMALNNAAKLIEQAGIKGEMPIGEAREKLSAHFRNSVHEIVTPTAQKTANNVIKAFESGQDTYYVRAGSTQGTSKSETYPNKIKDFVASAGFTVKDEGAVKAMAEETVTGSPYTTALRSLGIDMNVSTHVANYVMEFTDQEGEAKTLLFQSRGDNSFVPVIEDGALDKTVAVENLGETLKVSDIVARQTEGDAAKLSDKCGEFAEKFKAAPNEIMLVCTHFPAVEEALLAVHQGADGEIKTNNQSGIVKQIYEANGGNDGKLAVTGRLAEEIKAYKNESMEATTFVVHGGESTQEDLSVKDGVLRASTRHERNFQQVASNDSEQKMTRATLQSLAFSMKTADGQSVSMMQSDNSGRDIGVTWKQNRQASAPLDRANVFISNVNAAPETDAMKAKDTAWKTFAGELGLSGAAQKRMTTQLTQLAETLTLGELRGVDNLAKTISPGQEMVSATQNIVELILQNKSHDNDAKPDLNNPKRFEGKVPAAIVTGFTVVDAEGKRVAGENDGPAGSVVLAKAIRDNGTPVKLVFDRGSEASVYAAAKAAGLVEDVSVGGDNRNKQLGSLNAMFANGNLKPGVSVEIASVKDTTLEPGKTVGDIKQSLQEDNVGLVISIERPGPNEDGKLSNMRGQDITQFNADL